MSSRARVEEQAVSSGGTGLLLAVGLSICFLLLMAFLTEVKAGPLFTESNLL